MNPKGEEGEFYMKKSLLVLASIMILALCTFVACTAEVSDPYDGLTYVTFGGESPASRNLLASYEVASYDDLFWSYSAEKLDHYGTSGAATNAPVFEDSTTKGLNKTVGPFSQGKWRFTLCAYTSGTTRNEDTKVYEGSVEVSIKGQKVTVPVSVTPCGKTGALEFRGAYFAWKNNSEISTAVPTIMIVAKGTTNGYEYDLSNSFTKIKGANTKKMEIPLVIKDKDSEGKFYIDDTKAKFGSVVADYYTSTIIAYIDDPNTPIFSQTLGFRVYGSATTVISGDITEQSGTGVNFDPAKQDMAVFKGATTASVKVTPSGTDTTTVDFGANNLNNTSTYYLNVAATSVASAANKFTVSDSTKAPVAGIDLELVEVSSDGDNTNVTKFNEDLVTITTYIEKGLTGVKVYYNGAVCDDNPTYTPEDGKLVFKTNHFSEFYAVSDSVAVVSDQNETTKKGYARLVDAFDNSVDGCSIKLLKNIEMSSMVRITRSISVDLNGFAITTSSDFPAGAGIFTVREGGFLTIYDSSAGKTGLIENSKKAGDANSVERYGIVVFPYKSSHSQALNDSKYAKLIVNGGTIKASYAAISGNGEFGSETNTEIVVSGGVLEGGVTAVYHPQNGNIKVKGGSFKGNDSAIEIRAGEMTIEGGTFTANATEYSCTANGDGATTVGASIAVSQHNTKLPIDVVISDGTFNGYHALSVVNPQNNDYAAISKINVNVTGGEFTSTKASEGVEAVNYSSEFIRIDEGSSFTIRARNDCDEGNVTSLPDGRFFSSLQGAVDGVKDGSTVSLTLLNDVSEGGSLIVEDGRNLNLTLDFNGKTYYAFAADDSQKFDNTNAFEFRKDNTITLRNGKLTTKQKYGVTLIKNYSDLTLENFEIEGYKADGLYTNSSLSCNYGTTLITGNTIITGGSVYNSNALEVCYLFTDEYKDGVSVSFEDSFSGKVSGAVYFNLESDNDTSDYSHELVIESGNFSDAKFILPYAGNSSSFKVNKKTVGEGLSFVGNHYPVVEDGDYWVLDRTKAVVLNKTTGVVYEELGRAINNSSNGQVLVLWKSFDMKYSIANPFNSKSVTIDLNGKTIGVSDSVSKEILTIASGSVTIEDSSNGSGRLNKPIESFFKVSGGKLVINGGSFVSDPTAYVDKSTHDVAYSVSNKTWTVTSNKN